MIRFCFRKGLVFIEVQVRWQLIRRLVTGKLQFENETGAIANYSESEVLSFWAKGQWVVDEASLGLSADAMYLATPRDLKTYPSKWQEVARKRHQYILFINPEETGCRFEEWRNKIIEIAQKINDPKPPSPASVYSWWKRYRHTKSINTLIPRVKNGAPREAKPGFSIFEEVVQEVYLTNQKLPKKMVVEGVRKRVAQVNAAQPIDEQIRPPCRATIYIWLNDLRQDIVDAARLGAAASQAKYRAVKGSVKVDHVLERVEIDHTPLDFIVTDPLTYLPLGRPWLTMAIDRYSRMVLGFYVSFNAPSSHSVLQCLRRSVLPKDDWLKRFPKVIGPWPVFGIMVMIVIDNGMDLHSAAFEKTCQEMGIQIMYCPAREPQYKGAIERFFRTAGGDLIHQLPGTVFSSVDDRGDYPSEKVAAISLEAFMTLMTTWVVDIYNKSYHRGIKTSPLLKWQESVSRTRIELPVFPEQLAVISGIPAKRTVFHYGIELEGLCYNSNPLQELRRRSGKNLKVELKYYEDDLSYVHVYDPHSKEYIRVETISSPYQEVTPRAVHRLVRAQARKEFGEHYSESQLAQARDNIQECIRSSLIGKKMADRKLAASLLYADSEAVLADRSPLAAAKTRVRTVAPVPPTDLPDGLQDELPEFKPLGPSAAEGGEA